MGVTNIMNTFTLHNGKDAKNTTSKLVDEYGIKTLSLQMR